jgi:MYXO-CTERM domain-containing protein
MYDNQQYEAYFGAGVGDGANPLNSLVMKYTWYGDLDLDGVVDADDISLFIDGFMGVTPVTYLFGDLDYNGGIDADDMSLFIDGYMGYNFPAATSVEPASAPEPATLAVLLAGVAVLRRPRRIQR